MEMLDLVERVAEQMGYDTPNNQEFIDTMNDVANHGADSGWIGFTYYADTCAFYSANRRLIDSLAKDMADSCGNASVQEMVSQFGCKPDVDDEDQYQNALAWFALEEAARYVQDNEGEFEPLPEPIDAILDSIFTGNDVMTADLGI